MALLFPCTLYRSMTYSANFKDNYILKKKKKAIYGQQKIIQPALSAKMGPKSHLKNIGEKEIYKRQ